MNKIVTRLESADIAAVLKMLPHRYPFLMVDRVIDIRGDVHDEAGEHVVTALTKLVVRAVTEEG